MSFRFHLPCVLLMAAWSLSANARGAEKLPPPQIEDHARWMETHLDSLGARPLKQLVLPASHDSGMYEGGFPKSLARTQGLTIYGQLHRGVRYFDLRPQWHEGRLSIHHGPVIGPKLADVLADTRRFLAEGRRELVLLKFSHYANFHDAAYKSMIKQIDEALGPWLYTSLPKGKRLAEVTMGEYLRNAGAVLVLCDGRYPLDHPRAGVWVYRDWDSDRPEQGDLRVYDQYANTMAYEEMKADQFRKFQLFDGKCRRRPNVPCDLFLLSWTLTPPMNVREFSREPNRKLEEALKALKIPNRHGCIVNLLYADYVESARLTEAAIVLNLAIGPGQ